MFNVEATADEKLFGGNVEPEANGNAIKAIDNVNGISTISVKVNSYQATDGIDNVGFMYYDNFHMGMGKNNEQNEVTEL